MDATNHTCISCSESFSGNYCSSCGEKAIPTPINLKTFFSDVLSETFSFETPVLYTLKSFLKEPGLVPRKYIAGSRKTYAKPLSFFVLMVGVNYLLSSWLIDTEEMLRVMDDLFSEMLSTRGMENIELSTHNSLSQDTFRKMYFFMLPFVAFFSWLFFRKSGYNLIENVVASLYIQGGTFIFTILGSLLSLISLKVTLYFGVVINLATLVYIIWGFYQFHNQNTAGSVFKALLVYFLSMATSGALFYLIYQPLS